MPQTNSPVAWLQANVIRLVKVHFVLITIYAVYIVASDAWNLVTRQVTWQRWAVCCLMLVVMALLTYLGRVNRSSPTYYRILIMLVVLTDLLLASFVIYSERGMSSRGVAIYALAIVSSTALLNRSAIFGTATLATASYVLSATTYFYVNFNEGYKAELYTTLALYCSLFYILAMVLWSVLSYGHTIGAQRANSKK